jgi:hypothetical protein
VRGSVLIEPLREVVWRDVLEQALGAYGYAVEDDELRDELLAQLAETGSAMPLVQFALTELWHKRDVAKKRVTRAGLRALGGIAGALERHAEATFAKVAEAGSDGEEVARRVLLALTTPQGTRAERTIEELTRIGGSSTEAVLGAFEEARLVVRGAEGVDLAHEALLTQWGRLRTWVAEAREDRLLADELERDAAAWSEDPESAPLWQKRRLAYAEDLQRRSPLSAAALAFLKASRRSERRGRLLLAASVAVALTSLTVASLAYVRSERDKRVQQEERSRELQDKQRLIEGKQEQIDRLLRDLKDSETKEKALALQAEIRSAEGLPPAPSHAVAPTEPVAVRPPVAPVTPTAAPSSPPPSSSATTIKVKREW